MALKKPTPSFEENNDDGANAVAEEAQSPAVEETSAASADAGSTADHAVTATTAVAKASASSVATINEAAANAKRFQRELEEMRGASDFSFGNYRVFKGNNGEIAEMNGDKDSLGRWAKVRLMAWDEHFEVSPGTKEGKEFVAYSKDGKIIDSVIGDDQKKFVGKTTDEYLQYLQDTEGFNDAKVRRFIDTACALLGTDTGDGPIGEVIQITLSESSIPAFSKYQQALKDKAKCVAMGLPGFSVPEDPFTLYFIREAAEKGSNRWTKLKVTDRLPAKI